MKRRTRWFLVVAAMLACLGALMPLSCARLETLSSGGETRSYLLHVPKGYDARMQYPLVVAMHQFSDTPRGMESLSGLNDLADTENFLVVYPKGIRRGWNSGMRGAPDDVRFIEDLVDAIGGAYSIDRRRVYGLGISAGGMMAQWMACRSSLFAAIASVGGNLTDGASRSCGEGPAIPVMLIHGVDDPVVPYAGGETNAGPGMRPVFLSAEASAAFWAARSGCAETPAVDEVPPKVSDDPTRLTRRIWPCPSGRLVVLYSIAGGGHTWPGRDNWYPAFIVGATSMQMDATETIWAFLKEFSRP